jgi:hypothetical protein
LQQLPLLLLLQRQITKTLLNMIVAKKGHSDVFHGDVDLVDAALFIMVWFLNPSK